LIWHSQQVVGHFMQMPLAPRKGHKHAKVGQLAILILKIKVGEK
jgi:hypothetical protein